jgi:hypothetical protein
MEPSGAARRVLNWLKNFLQCRANVSVPRSVCLLAVYWNDVVTYGDCEEPAPTITERFHCEDETPTSGNHAFDIWTAPL